MVRAAVLRAAFAILLCTCVAPAGATTPTLIGVPTATTATAGSQVGPLSASQPAEVPQSQIYAAAIAQPEPVIDSRSFWQSVTKVSVFGTFAAFIALMVRGFGGPKRSPSVLTPLNPRDGLWGMASTTGEDAASLAPPSDSFVKRWRLRAAGGFLVAALFAVSLLLVPSLPAEAAQTGGRMGGGSFSSARSYSRPAPSSGRQSLRAPPLRGGGVVYAPSFVAPMTGYGVGGLYGGWGWGLGGGLFNGIFLITMMSFVFNFFQGMFGSSPDNDLYEDEGDMRGSVIKLQVGLSGQAKDLQKNLNSIAEKADTDSPEGLHFILQEVVLALLRNPEYCSYGFTEGMQGLDMDRTEDYYNRESMVERGKIKEETMVNYEGVAQSKAKGTNDGAVNELIVVTLLVAVAGKLSLPAVVDNASLKEALRKLGGIRREDVIAVEVLWTPQEEGDTLTLDDFIKDYPRLNRL